MSTPARHKVVVIDDERPILLTLEALLARHGYDPKLAHTAAAGLAMIRETRLIASASCTVILALGNANLGGFAKPGIPWSQ